MRVVTFPGAIEALRPELTAVSLKAAAKGVAAAKALARVDTGAMRASVLAVVSGPGACRVAATAPHSAFNEFGTSKMRAKPFVRPSMIACKL